jgi:hypothetical protein
MSCRSWRRVLAAGEATRGQLKAAEHAVRTIRKSRHPGRSRRWLNSTPRSPTPARDHTPVKFRRIAEHLVRVITHDTADTLDEHELEQRKLVHVAGVERLDRDRGLPATRHRSLAVGRDGPLGQSPDPGRRGRDADAEEMLPIHDRRSKRQRQADALGLAMRWR